MKHCSKWFHITSFFVLYLKYKRIFLFCFAIFFVPSACTKSPTQATPNDEKQRAAAGQGKLAEASGKLGKRGPVIVQVLSAKKMRAAQSAEFSVPLVGRKQTNVFSKVAGRVSKIMVPEGGLVRAGQTLFQVDRSEPGESYLSVPVTSPISGWVGRWNVTEGTQVSPQEGVVLVVDDQTLIANIFLPVQEWIQIKLNSKVSIKVQQTVRPAKILTIARAAESGSGRGALTVEVDNRDHAFKSGVVAMASLELDTRDRLLLPASALRISDQGAAVFIVEESKAKRQRVEYALFDNDTVEILSGVQEDALVVNVGAHQLFDGAEVKIAEPGESLSQGKGEENKNSNKEGRQQREGRDK